MMPRGHVASLRTTMALATAGLAAIAILVSGVLVALTTVLHRTTSNAGASAEGIRLAQDAEIDLLLHARATDPLITAELENRLQARLEQARHHVTTERQSRALAQASSTVNAYIAGARTGLGEPALDVRHQQAFRSLEGLVTANLAQSRRAEAAATRWNQVADIVGVVATTLLLLGVGGTLFWLKRRALLPVLALADVMERFRRGDREARASEAGARELRDIIRRFNEMAAALAAEHRNQMAFLGGVAHDIRNPVSVLKMAVAALRPERPLPPEPKIREIVRRIDRQLTRLERMLGDFLDMAKIEAGELELRLAPHDLRAIAHEVASLFEAQLSGRQLEVLEPDRAVVVRCDQLRLEQVLSNLVSNAIKYSPLDSRVVLAVEEHEQEAVVSVANQGQGLSDDEREHVFEPFRRVGPSRAAVAGSGLGLFVVRRIVEAHGGRVTVESHPGAGATFRVHLPHSRESAPERGNTLYQPIVEPFRPSRVT